MRFRRALALVSLFSLAAFMCGGIWTFLLSTSVSADTQKELKPFTDVLDIVKRIYVHEPKDEELVSGAIKGMLEELDPHSVYLSKEEFQEMQADTRGQFGGLGIEISKKEGELIVVSPIEDTPAFRAGIKAGDVIFKIEDKFTDKMSIFDAVKLMRGAPGTKINVSIKRKDVPKLIEIDIERAIIQVKSVSFEKVDGFGVIKVKQFLEKSSAELKKALRALKKGGELKGLVLDLRNNPGGLLQQAVEVSDVFLDKGLIVYTMGRDKQQVDKKYAVSKGTEPNYPLVVLLNGGSASASEIVAGALKDHQRAHIMGIKSFGKGSVQNVIPLDNGGGLKLTVALYYTPSGRSIQGDGITPDKMVESLDGIDPGDYVRESDLPGHIVGENEKAKKKKAAEVAKKEKEKMKIDQAKLTALEKKDFQLAKAIDYLKEQASKKAEKKK